MAASAFTLYTAAKLALLEGQLSLSTAKIQVVLLTAAYVPAASNALYSDISANEVSGAAGTGYTTGGQALAGQSVTAAGSGAAFTGNSSVWSGATMAPKFAALVEMAGTTLAPSDKLIGYIDLNLGGGAISVASASLTLAWPSAGILTLS
jgi:uncharacterized membrane protein